MRSMIKWQSHLFILMGTVFFTTSACNQQPAADIQAAVEEEDLTVLLNDMPYVEAELLHNPVLQAPTLEAPLTILVDGAPSQLEAESFIFMDSTGQRYTIWSCLDSIALTTSQKDSLRIATRRFVACRQGTIQEIRQINRTIIAGANIERAALIKAYRNGQITLRQLKNRLQQLYIKTRFALKNNPVKARHIAQLRACYKRYLRRLHQHLSPAQWSAFIQCFSAIRAR